jgi:L-lactate utilization protein LutC
VAVVRAAFAVAETGSILLTENELGINSLAYLAQHLIVLLDPADIVDSTSTPTSSRTSSRRITPASTAARRPRPISRAC